MGERRGRRTTPEGVEVDSLVSAGWTENREFMTEESGLSRAFMLY